MNYVVRPLPQVTGELARAERWVQDEFQHIASILAMNPYPNPQFPLITEDRATDGSTVYTYSDDYFPYAIHFVVFDPTDELYGMVVAVDLTPLQGT